MYKYTNTSKYTYAVLLEDKLIKFKPGETIVSDINIPHLAQFIVLDSNKKGKK